MKVVYISGPIRHKWRIGRWLNLLRGRGAAIKLWNAGFAVICPHLNSATLRHHTGEEELIAGDCEIVRRCDFVVFIGKWIDSERAIREHNAIIGTKVRSYTDVDTAIECERVAVVECECLNDNV